MRQPCLELQLNVQAGGLGVSSLFPSFTILIVQSFICILFYVVFLIVVNYLLTTYENFEFKF